MHYDGAKDEETVIQVWGMGPATVHAGGDALTQRARRTAPGA